MKWIVPLPEAKTPGLTIVVPPESKQAIGRTVGGLVAAVIGGVLAVLAVQKRVQNVPVVVPLSPTPVAAPVLRAAEKAVRVHRDIFFSNFAETNLPDFGAARLAPAETARFVALHALVNTPEQVETGANGRRFVSPENVARTVDRYFDAEAVSDAPPGAVAVAASLAPPQTLRFARVTRFMPLVGAKSDTFVATVRVYAPPPAWKGDPYNWTLPATPAPSEPRFVGTWRATVRKVPGGYDPGYRYLLLSWKRL